LGAAKSDNEQNTHHTTVPSPSQHPFYFGNKLLLQIPIKARHYTCHDRNPANSNNSSRITDNSALTKLFAGLAAIAPTAKNLPNAKGLDRLTKHNRTKVAAQSTLMERMIIKEAFRSS
jgi:hypothetical protein